MPIISITTGQLSDVRQKAELIRGLTSAAVQATGIAEQSFTVLIHELDELNIGLGGRTLAEIKKSR